MAELIFLIICGFVIFTLAIREAPLWLWAASATVALLLWQSGIFFNEPEEAGFGFGSFLAWLPVLGVAALSVPGIRRALVVEPVFKMVKKIMPKVSETEQVALDAGTIGFDAQLFSGKPD